MAGFLFFVRRLENHHFTYVERQTDARTERFDCLNSDIDVCTVKVLVIQSVLLVHLVVLTEIHCQG